MSKNIHSREEAIDELYAMIKKKFDDDGVLQEMRCLLHAKMIAMMRGKNETKPLHQCTGSTPPVGVKLSGAGCSGGGGDGKGKRDPRVQVLHQLIMEYFHWHGFQYSAEMLSIESAMENAPPVRECLEGVLGEFEYKNIPILLELVAELMKKKKN